MGILPFIKKKVEGFSFVFTVYSGLRVCFSPIWNLAPGSFPQTAGVKKPVWKTDTNGGFPHWFYPLRRGGEITPSGANAPAPPRGRLMAIPETLPPPLKPSPWGRWLDAKRQDGRGTCLNSPSLAALDSPL